MQVKRLSAGLTFLFAVILIPAYLNAQVNTVEFGKNRVQNKKFKWKFYQSPNFNVYFNQGGLELAKDIVQVAEEELPGIEKLVEYSLQRRANIVIYDNYEDYKTSNIGLGIDWQNAGGLTKLVNNKMVLYFDGNHNNLRRHIREGIAKILSDNILFGDDIGEFASNAALLDLPQWLTDGYVQYVAEPWNLEKDDQLRNAMLAGEYKNFYAFAFDKPTLAGNAFWYYIAEKYKPENVTYFLYLARLYKNLNTAAQRICKKKFKEVLSDFMEYEEQKYANDLKQRKNVPKGKLTVVEESNKKIDYFRFTSNPNPKNSSYSVVKFKEGVYSVKYVDNFYDEHDLVKYGVRMLGATANSNYPIMAWDGKGSRLLVMYPADGKLYMFVYDVIAGIKRFKQEVEGFDQVLDASFMLDANTLLLSAVKNGHTDIFTYKIDNGKIKAITNDVFDDLDPAFVSFPNRTGIIFASNRPGVAATSDTAVPSRNHYNIFLVDLLNDGSFKQITQLTNVKYGNARYPTPYNTNHFTYVNDENGIANRWAGFFTTQRTGLDTLYYIGDEILRNPVDKEIDSTLNAWQKQEPDSISYFQVYKDSTYTFPITNYQTSLLESRVAGNNQQVSEVRREGDEKFLYKLRVDSVSLRKRNVNARPTDYIKKLVQRDRLAGGRAATKIDSALLKPKKSIFQNEFEDEKPDSSSTAPAAQNANPAGVEPGAAIAQRINYLNKSSLFDYRLKFNADYVLLGVTNNILVNRFQPFAYGNGPIQLNNGNNVNFTFRVGASDIMEDVKIIGGVRLGTTLSDKDVFISFQNYRRRLDWGLTYYRSNITNFPGLYTTAPYSVYDNALYTNLYQGNISYPFNEINSLRFMAGIRSDRSVLRPYDNSVGLPDPGSLSIKDSIAYTAVTHLEFVHDNTVNPAQNIWNGLRYKIYADVDFPLTSQGSNSAIDSKGKPIYNLGFDARYYYKIYRNFIWAVRGAGDFSFGDAKIIYYLGGADGWISPKFNNTTPVNLSNNYAYQSLALNLRGFKQNVANGNNAMVINSELRLPVFTTFFNKPINNAFLRNFQLVQFIDLGTAWEGSLKNLERPFNTYVNEPVHYSQRVGGVGPFAGGYGFGARSTLLGYFLKIDAGWPMGGFFRGSPMWYFALGFDF